MRAVIFIRCCRSMAFAETAQQRLISLYLHQGEISLALRQYRQFEDMLQRELNVAPVPETQALLTDILRRQRSPTGQPLPPGRSSIPRAQVLPFVGRGGFTPAIDRDQ